MSKVSPDVEASTLELMLELGASLSSMSPDLCRELERMAAAEADGVRDALGLEPGCLVRVTPGDGDEPLRVHLSGRVLGSPAGLAGQLWEAVFPEEELGESGIAPALANKMTGSARSQRDHALAYLSALAAETVKLRPERLLRWADVERIAEAQRKRSATIAEAAINSPKTGAPEMADLGRVLHELLALGIACSPHNPTLLEGLVRHVADGTPQDECIEILVAELRRHTIEVRVEREYLEGLLERDVDEPVPLSGAAARATELFYLMSDGLFHELGIRLPPIVLVADDTLPARCCRICIDDAPGPLLALIALDTVLVNVPREDLEREKIAARRARNPATGQAASVVSMQDADKMKAQGHSIWAPFEYLILALSARFRESASHLVDCETVEYELSLLDSAFPDLVRGTLMCVPISHLTAAIRGLLKENVSVRNLRAILERMAGCRAQLAGAEDRVLLDGRIDSRSADAQAAQLQYLRIGLKHAINAQHARAWTLFVYLLAPEIEARFMRHLGAAGAGIGPQLNGTQLDDLRSVVSEFHPDAPNAVLLTNNSLRLAVRDLLRDALPQVAVLAWEELSPEWSISPVASILVPQSWRVDALTAPHGPANGGLTETLKT